jgi:hypothetical protein
MSIDEKIALADELIRKRREIDQQLAALFGGETIERKTRICSICNAEGHTARSCPQRPNSNSDVTVS